MWFAGCLLQFVWPFAVSAGSASVNFVRCSPCGGSVGYLNSKILFPVSSIATDLFGQTGSNVPHCSGERFVASNSGLQALRSASQLHCLVCVCVENPFYPIASYI